MKKEAVSEEKLLGVFIRFFIISRMNREYLSANLKE